MRGMSMDNILGDPFALATISIAVVCWRYPHLLRHLPISTVTDQNHDSLRGSLPSSDLQLQLANTLVNHFPIILGLQLHTCYALS